MHINHYNDSVIVTMIHEIYNDLMNLCDPFSRAPHRRRGGDGMRKKDTKIPPERAFLC
jgi:hypothetical protein